VITCCPGSVSSVIGIAEATTLVLSQSQGSLHILYKVIENFCGGAGRTDKVDRAVDPPEDEDKDRTGQENPGGSAPTTTDHRLSG
jgi:hypothetical protein